MFTDVSIANLSASGLLTIVVLLVLGGLLVPRRTLKDKDTDLERWRKAYETERTARGIADAQLNELLEMARANHEIVKAISQTSERIRQSGAPDATTPS